MIYRGKLLKGKDYFMYMSMSVLLSQRSQAERLKVGCIITDRFGNILGSGYNHMPNCTGTECCEIEGGLVSNPLVCHAEKHAVRSALDRNLLMGSIAFVTDVPCLGCAEELLSVGVGRVLYNRPYRLTAGLELLLDNMVEVYHVDVAGLMKIVRVEHNEDGSTEIIEEEVK